MALLHLFSSRTHIGFYATIVIGLTYWLIWGGGSFALLWLSLPQILLYAAVYVSIGILWSFYKWYRLSNSETTISEMKSEYERWKKQEQKYKNLEEYLTEDEYKEAFINDRKENSYHFRNHLFQIHKWVIYWPISIIASLCGNLLYNGLAYVIKSFGGIYQKISGHANKL